MLQLDNVMQYEERPRSSFRRYYMHKVNHKVCNQVVSKSINQPLNTFNVLGDPTDNKFSFWLQACRASAYRGTTGIALRHVCLSPAICLSLSQVSGRSAASGVALSRAKPGSAQLRWPQRRRISLVSAARRSFVLLLLLASNNAWQKEEGCG